MAKLEILFKDREDGSMSVNFDSIEAAIGAVQLLETEGYISIKDAETGEKDVIPYRDILSMMVLAEE